MSQNDLRFGRKRIDEITQVAKLAAIFRWQDRENLDSKKLMTFCKRIAVLITVLGTWIGGNTNLWASFDLNIAFSGNRPSGSAPWLKADFSDNASGGVFLTLTALLKDSSEYVKSFYFNVEEKYLTLGTVSINLVSGGTGPSTISYYTTGSATPDTISGYYDVSVNFNTADTQTRLDGNESVKFLITSTLTGLHASDFSFKSLKSQAPLGADTYYAAALIGGFGADGKGKGTIVSDGLVTPVPEPSTYLAGLCCLGILGSCIWRKQV